MVQGALDACHGRVLQVNAKCEPAHGPGVCRLLPPVSHYSPSHARRVQRGYDYPFGGQLPSRGFSTRTCWRKIGRWRDDYWIRKWNRFYGKNLEAGCIYEAGSPQPTRLRRARRPRVLRASRDQEPRTVSRTHRPSVIFGADEEMAQSIGDSGVEGGHRDLKLSTHGQWQSQVETDH